MRRAGFLIVSRCPDNLAGRLFRRPSGNVLTSHAVIMASSFLAEKTE